MIVKKLNNTTLAIAVMAVMCSCGNNTTTSYEKIIFGTDINPAEQVLESQRIAQAVADSNSPSWQTKGDQLRTYFFEEANEEMPFRVCVPNDWDGKSELPLVMFLHGGWNTESSYLDQDDSLMVKIADSHNMLLVSPLGAHAAFGNNYVLPAVFGRDADLDTVLSKLSDKRAAAQLLSEKDVINVLEIVLAEYPIDRDRMFLTGHSMGSGGTWYIGGKYSDYWRALAPMSGPFVSQKGYPWENLRDMPIFISEGSLADASLQGSRDLRDWMMAAGFNVTYKEVEADHPGMVPLILPDVFDFFANIK